MTARTRVAVSLALAVAVTACGGPDAAPAGTSRPLQPAPAAQPVEALDNRLPAFRDCHEYVAHMRAVTIARLEREGSLYHDTRTHQGYRHASDVAAAALGPAPDRPVTGTAPWRYGVATDGRLLVSAEAEAITVVDVSTDQPRVLSRLVLPSPGYLGTQILLAGSRALVVQNSDTDDWPYGSLGPVDDFDPTSQLTLVDLRDPERPAVLAHETVTAQVLAAGRTGDTVRLVLMTPRHRNLPDGLATAPAVRRVPAEGWLPDRQIRDATGKVRRSGPLVPCLKVRRPAVYSGADVLTVLSIDPARDDALEAAEATGILAAGDQVALSGQRLFVATVPGRTTDQPVTREGRPPELPDGPRTLVHAFAWTATDVGYLASAPLAAYVSGPGAGPDVMSARGTTLRVVTSRVPPWWSRYAHRQARDDIGVAVLAERDGRPAVVGTLGGLAQGREPKVVRWFDDFVALAPHPRVEPDWTPNAHAGAVDLVSLADPGRPVRIGSLPSRQPTAELLPVGDGLLVGSGERAGAEHREDCCARFFSVAAGTAGAGPRQLDSVSFGRGDWLPTLWLPAYRLLVSPWEGSVLEGCPGADRCARNDLGCRASPPWQSAIVAVRVAEDGKLDPLCHSTGDRWPGVLLPLRDRFVSVGADVTVYDPDGLRPLRTARVRSP